MKETGRQTKTALPHWPTLLCVKKFEKNNNNNNNIIGTRVDLSRFGQRVTGGLLPVVFHGPDATELTLHSEQAPTFRHHRLLP